MSEINNNYIELVLPVLPLRGIVGFPAVQMNIEIARASSLKAFTAAATLHDAKMLLVAQKELNVESPTEDDMYKTGVLAEIKHVVKNPHGNLSVVFEGLSRARIESVSSDAGYLTATVLTKKEHRTCYTHIAIHEHGSLNLTIDICIPLQALNILRKKRA